MMYSNEFEMAFSEFLERHEYDEAEQYLFFMVRLAFSAGWQAAGGNPPKAERLFELLKPQPPQEPQTQQSAEPAESE